MVRTGKKIGHCSIVGCAVAFSDFYSKNIDAIPVPGHRKGLFAFGHKKFMKKVQIMLDFSSPVG